MRRTVSIIVIAFISVLLAMSAASCERAAWDCPGCGRTGNTGNYCGGCAHPAPWMIKVGDILILGRCSQSYSEAMTDEEFYFGDSDGDDDLVPRYGDDDEETLFRKRSARDDVLFSGSEDIEWYILDIQDNRALLISKYGLESVVYDYSQNSNLTFITWKNSFVRKWLNETFFTRAFSKEEQAVILETVTDNRKDDSLFSEWMEMDFEEAVKDGLIVADDAYSDTIDRVFLPSYREYNKYLYAGEDSEYLAKNGFAERYEYGGAANPGYWNNGYWLRDTVWYASECEAYTVNISGFLGDNESGVEPVSLNGEFGNIDVFARPCIWIDLDAYDALHRGR